MEVLIQESNSILDEGFFNNIEEVKYFNLYYDFYTNSVFRYEIKYFCSKNKKWIEWDINKNEEKIFYEYKKYMNKNDVNADFYLYLNS
jgi:hypothetical protein